MTVTVQQVHAVRCPTCGQPITKPQRRVCADCHRPILKGHKFRFDGSSVRHRCCESPMDRRLEKDLPAQTGELLI